MGGKLFLSLALHQKLTAYGEAAPHEVSGLGFVTKLENRRDFRVTDVMLFKQKANGGETKLDTEDVSAWMVEAVKKSIPLQDVRFWWHFHLGRNDQWSGGDDDQIESWNGQCSWMVSLLLTKSGQMRARVDIYDPVRATADLEVIVETPGYEEMKQQCAAEVAEKVRIKKPPVATIYNLLPAWLKQQSEEVEDEWYFPA